MTLITLCMIIKNEEAELPLVLDSAKGLVDEMVIYDTGSTDNSVVTARRLGAKVIEGYWDSDFSRARNASLEACSSEWILWLDADEAIHGNFALTREILEKEEQLDAFLIPIESVELHGIGTAATFHATRLFRREKCHWSGPLHEQVTLRSDDDFPAALFMHHLRILHRGYTNMKWKSKDLINRNLAIAKKALDDPNVPKARALFDYGRTLTQGDDPLSAVPILEEAAATTDSPTIKRAAYRVMFEIYLTFSMLDQAEEVINILRKEYKTSYTVDSMYAKLLLEKKSYQECIRIVDRIPYSTTDDDGVEIGRHNLAWIKANAQSSLNRPGEAADTLLNVLRQQGKLDENLRVLVSYLQEAGREVEEIATATREESVGIMSALAGTLNIEDADRLLAKFLEIYPRKKEPLAALINRLSELPIARQLWWSNELRTRGLSEECPLIKTIKNIDIDLAKRLLAGAAAYLTFQDQRAADEGRKIYSKINDDTKNLLDPQINGISPAYLEIIRSGTKAAHITLIPCSCAGYEHYIYIGSKKSALGGESFPNSGSFDKNFSPPLPISKEIFHEIKLDSLVACLSHIDASRFLKTCHNLLRDGGRLKFKVTDIYGAIKNLEKGDLSGARKILYASRPQSQDRADIDIHDAWGKDEICNFITSSNFSVEAFSVGDFLSFTCKKERIDLSKRSVRPVENSILLLVNEKTENSDFINCLQTLNENGDLEESEVVIVTSGQNDEIKTTIGLLDGDIVKINLGRNIDFATALDIGIQNSHGENIVYLQLGISPAKISVKNLAGQLAGGNTGFISPAIADENRIILNAGYNISTDDYQSLVIEAHKTYMDASLHLESDLEVDAIHHLCFAIKKSTYQSLAPLTPFLRPRDALIDLSLRAKEAGYVNKIASAEYLKSKYAADELNNPILLGYQDFFYPEQVSLEMLEAQWAGRVIQKEAKTSSVTASNLLPTTTVIERIQSVLSVANKPKYGGINLIADFSSDISYALESLIKESGLRVSKINFDGSEIKQMDEHEFLHYYTNLLCIPGYQLVDFVGYAGIDVISKRYNILYWNWPLEKPHDDARSETAMVHEIWVPSKFTYKSLKDISSRPLYLVQPFAKSVIQPYSVIQEGKENDFIHVTRLHKGWDCEVITDNTIATIKTFIQAFKDTDTAGLKIIIVGEDYGKLLSACQSTAKGSLNISIDATLDRTLIRDEIIKSNCYISLHQAGAYNLDALTAIANGIPVITTNYGGITDLIGPDIAEAVPYTYRSLSENLFPLLAEDEFGAPDMNSALAAMQRVKADYTSAQQKAWLGRKRVNAIFSSKQNVKSLRTNIERIEKSSGSTKTING